MSESVEDVSVSQAAAPPSSVSGELGAVLFSNAVDRFRVVVRLFCEGDAEEYEVEESLQVLIAARYATNTTFPRSVFAVHGWSLDFSFLRRVQHEAAHRLGCGEDDAPPSLEAVEAVLLCAPVVAANDGTIAPSEPKVEERSAAQRLTDTSSQSEPAR